MKTKRTFAVLFWAVLYNAIVDKLPNTIAKVCPYVYCSSRLINTNTPCPKESVRQPCWNATTRGRLAREWVAVVVRDESQAGYPHVTFCQYGSYKRTCIFPSRCCCLYCKALLLRKVFVSPFFSIAKNNLCDLLNAFVCNCLRAHCIFGCGVITPYCVYQNIVRVVIFASRITCQ